MKLETTRASDRENGNLVQQELPLVIVGSSEFRDAILATTVDRFSNPRYWEDWANKVGDIAQRHEARIRALLKIADSGVRPIFAAISWRTAPQFERRHH